MHLQKTIATLKQLLLSSFRRGLAVTTLLTITVLLTAPAEAQFTVIHNFTGGGDGATPYGGLTFDSAGNIYGTASAGGAEDYGTVFKLSPYGSNYTLTTVYAFKNGQDGSYPTSGITRASNGLLYGAAFGGGAYGKGTIYRLSPPGGGGVNSAWHETTLYSFTGGSDGSGPDMIGGYLRFDHQGNLFGTTAYGGDANASCALPDNGCGTVFKLEPISGGWTQTVVHAFAGSPDGATPFGDVALDSSGNVYGMTLTGGDSDDPYGGGTLFQLSPSGSGYSEHIVLNFGCFFGGCFGANPSGGLVLDSSGYLYGYDGFSGAFQAYNNGYWHYVSEFSATSYGDLVFDSSGNLYGTSQYGGAFQNGYVFKLTPNGFFWLFTSLHDFTGGGDGGQPYGTLALDSAGNLYGTASIGGSGGSCQSGCGVVFKIHL